MMSLLWSGDRNSPTAECCQTYESWTASLHPVTGVDLAAMTISLATPFNTAWAGGASGNRFYLQNMIEALDEPGEFYFDRTSNVLRCAPAGERQIHACSWMAPAGLDPNDMYVVAPQMVEVCLVSVRRGTKVASAGAKQRQLARCGRAANPAA